MFDSQHETGAIDKALQLRTAIPSVEPGSQEEREAVARLDNVRDDELRRLRPGERARARARHRRHWQRHFGGV